MKSVGEFVFKGIEERAGGEFVNDKGQAIKYDGSYILKVDEKTEKGIYERKLKIAKDNMALVNKLKGIEVYTPIKVECEFAFYGNKVTVIPTDLK